MATSKLLTRKLRGWELLVFAIILYAAGRIINSALGGLMIIIAFIMFIFSIVDLIKMRKSKKQKS